MKLFTSNDGVPIWSSPSKTFFQSMKPTSLVRYVIDIKNQCLAKDHPPKLISSRWPEFPSTPSDISTHKNRYSYPIGLRECTIMKVDAENPSLNEVYSFEPYEFPGEAG